MLHQSKVVFLILVFVPDSVCQLINYFLGALGDTGQTGSSSEDIVWEVGSSQFISWSSNYAEIVLTLWQDPGGSDRAYLIKDPSTISGLVWVVDLTSAYTNAGNSTVFDLSLVNTFHLALYNATSGDLSNPGGFNSVLFPITSSSSSVTNNTILISAISSPTTSALLSNDELLGHDEDNKPDIRNDFLICEIFTHFTTNRDDSINLQHIKFTALWHVKITNNRRADSLTYQPVESNAFEANWSIPRHRIWYRSRSGATFSPGHCHIRLSHKTRSNQPDRSLRAEQRRENSETKIMAGRTCACTSNVGKTTPYGTSRLSSI
ncbi:MAG: hypothetical protein MMC33_007238 [Icmadophila ericetorum]|nr:hypothetical protein [Icmadophila ericetorum]